MPDRKTREVVRPASHDPGGAILDTIAGGISGSPIDEGNHKVLGAALGAVAATARPIAPTQRRRKQRRCSATVEHFEKHAASYEVTYKYAN